MLGYMHSNACVFEWVNGYGSRNTFGVLRVEKCHFRQQAHPFVKTTENLLSYYCESVMCLTP